jgi:alanyl aminopeptidase
MFEAFLGPDRFRDGIRRYMQQYAFANTTAHDFIGAIAAANPQVNGEDLQAAFSSFIEQPGLPVLQADVDCGPDGPAFSLGQKRYLPLGSTGSPSQTWLIPTCVTAFSGSERNSQCLLLKQAQAKLPLDSGSCPDALLPNSGGAGYYRWSLPPQQWQSLLAKFDRLDTPEQLSLAGSLSAALNDGSLALADYLDTVGPLTRADTWRVAIAPRADLYKIREHVLDGEERQALEARMREWYRPVLARLEALPERTADEQQFRMMMMSTLALGAGDRDIHRRLADMGAALTGFGGDARCRLCLDQ